MAFINADTGEIIDNVVWVTATREQFEPWGPEEILSSLRGQIGYTVVEPLEGPLV